MNIKTALGYIVAVKAAGAVPALALIAGIALFEDWSNIAIAGMALAFITSLAALYIASGTPE